MYIFSACAASPSFFRNRLLFYVLSHLSDDEKDYSFQTATGLFHPLPPPPALWDRKEEMGLVNDAMESAAVRAQCAS